MRARRTATWCTRRTRWPTAGTPRSPPASGTRCARARGALLRLGRPRGGWGPSGAACWVGRIARAHHLCIQPAPLGLSRTHPFIPLPPSPPLPSPPAPAAQEAVRRQPGGHGGLPVCARHRLQLRQPRARGLVLLPARRQPGGAPHAAPQVGGGRTAPHAGPTPSERAHCQEAPGEQAPAALPAKGAAPIGPSPRLITPPRQPLSSRPLTLPLPPNLCPPALFRQCWHRHACSSSLHTRTCGTLLPNSPTAGGLRRPIWRAPAARRAGPNPLALLYCQAVLHCSPSICRWVLPLPSAARPS